MVHDGERFKIDLIVWKPTHSNDSNVDYVGFKIDLIVWKRRFPMSWNTIRQSLKLT